MPGALGPTSRKHSGGARISGEIERKAPKSLLGNADLLQSAVGEAMLRRLGLGSTIRHVTPGRSLRWSVGRGASPVCRHGATGYQKCTMFLVSENPAPEFASDPLRRRSLSHSDQRGLGCRNFPKETLERTSGRRTSNLRRRRALKPPLHVGRSQYRVHRCLGILPKERRRDLAPFLKLPERILYHDSGKADAMPPNPRHEIWACARHETRLGLPHKFMLHNR